MAVGRLNELTTWIAVGALAAVGVFAVIAAETVPGKASSSQGAANTSTSSATASTSTSTAFPRHHHLDSGTVSASSGPPMVVTGGSR